MLNSKDSIDHSNQTYSSEVSVVKSCVATHLSKDLGDTTSFEDCVKWDL